MKYNTVLLFLVLLLSKYHTTAQSVGPGEWLELNGDAPWAARAGLQAVYHNNTLFLLGGRTPNPPSDPIIPGDSRIWNDVWISEDLGVTWTELLAHDETDSLHWPARAYFQAVQMGEYIYVLGGQNFKSEPNPDCPPPFNNCSPFISTSDFFNDVWRSQDGLQWEMMTDSAGWSGRAGFSCVVYNNEIYVMGGSINDDAAIVGGPPARIYLNDVWKSADGANWELLTAEAPWEKRAGGIALAKDEYIYLLGGEEGFVCLPGSPCPPYFNDVWRTADGVNWEEINPNSAWKKRPGHQVVVLDDYFVLFGGFGLSENIFDPFAPSNPRDVWVSRDGVEWERISRRPWNALTQAEVKYDFDAISLLHPLTGKMTAYTFGGDRETFDFTDPLNYLNVDNDVWQFCLEDCSVISSAVEINTAVADRLEIYPNPAAKTIYVRNPGFQSSLLEYELRDASGRILMAEHVQADTHTGLVLNIGDFEAGWYVLLVKDDRQLYAGRLLKIAR
jgi:hypothetical protein